MKTLYKVWLLIAALISTGCAEEYHVSATKPINSYSRTFNDLNDLHKEAAEKIGIAPVRSREAAEKLGRRLKPVKSNRYYEVDKLTHSLPYLVPEAEKLLADIGKDFQKRLDKADLPQYRVRVTSVLRTGEDIKKLSRRNVNSSSNSAHLHATTFDISYVRFEKVNQRKKNVSDIVLKRTLGETLRYYKEAKRCYVKYEVKQGCFHITARK